MLCHLMGVLVFDSLVKKQSDGRWLREDYKKTLVDGNNALWKTKAITDERVNN